MSDCRKRRTWARSTALALIATAVSFAALDLAAAQGMNVMRTPNIDVGSRIPVNPTIAPRVDPNIAGRTNTNINTNVISVDRATPRITPRIPNPNLPYARFSPNLYPSCEAANRGADGECAGNPAGGGSGTGGNNKSVKQVKKGGTPSSGAQQTGLTLTTNRNRFVAER